MVKITVGMEAEMSKLITENDINTFAEIVGDRNPVHLDEAYARTTPFKQRIAHGTLTGALISAVLAQKLPGLGTIYLSQSYQFKAPVFIGDEITAKVKVTNYREDKRLTTLDTNIYNQEGKCVLTGEAVVIAPK